MTFQKGISIVSHNYDTVLRAVPEKDSREATILPPSKYRRVDEEYRESVSAFRGIFFAGVIGPTFFWIPMGVVLFLLWRQA